MKIIEAMKRVKTNKVKIIDLQNLIKNNSAHVSVETSPYPDPKAKVAEWAQAATDLTKENCKLLVSIGRTNLATPVTIKLGDNSLTKSIAEWVWRRREYAGIDFLTWQGMTDRGLREGQAPSSTSVPLEVKIVRNYDPELRDKNLAIFKSEAHEIDSALEVVNAVTDLIED